MEEPRQPESFSSCRNVTDVAYYVRNKVELCIQNYMSLEVTATYLERTHRISKSVTHIVWEQLREENPVFFKHFEMRCQMALQMRKFNDMLTKQAVGMFENGLLDISDASPSIRALLRQQHPERVHLLETLASKTKLSSASFAFHNANGPSVASQMQIRYNQRKQVLVPASFAMPNPSGPSVVQSRNPYDQQNQVLNPTSFAMPNPSGPFTNSAAQWQIPNEQHLYAPSLALSNANGMSVTPLPIPNDQQEQQDQHRFTTNSPLPYANGPSVTQMPIPYDQQEQPLYTTTSLPLPPYANGPSMTQLPVPYDQQKNQTHQDPCSTYNDLISPTFAPPADPVDWSLLIDPAFDDLRALSPLPPADTNPWPASDYSPWTDPMPEELSTFELGGDILSAEGMHLNEQQQHLIGQYQSHWQQQQNVQVQGSNGHLENGDELFCNNFDITPPMQTYTSVHQQPQAGGVTHHHPDSEAVNNTDNSEQPQDLNGHYQPQEKVPVETLQREGRSNGVVNGESNDHHQFYNKLDKSRSKRTCTNVDQSGRVKRHNHEPEALNNADTGDGTQTTGVNQQRSPKARATTRSLTGREQYESEETKQ